MQPPLKRPVTLEAVALLDHFANILEEGGGRDVSHTIEVKEDPENDVGKTHVTLTVKFTTWNYQRFMPPTPSREPESTTA